MSSAMFLIFGSAQTSSKTPGAIFAQQVQRVEHRQRGVAVILCALGCSSRRHRSPSKVDAVGGLLHIGGQVLGRGEHWAAASSTFWVHQGVQLHIGSSPLPIHQKCAVR